MAGIPLNVPIVVAGGGVPKKIQVRYCIEAEPVGIISSACKKCHERIVLSKDGVTLFCLPLADSAKLPDAR